LANQRVAGDYRTALRQVATAPAIQEYYNAKYEWSETTMADIHWRAHGKALTKLPSRTCKTITQMLHQWLPVNASYSINALGTGKLCPFCSTCDEDDKHFLSCPHPIPSQMWSKAASTITKSLIRYDKHVDRQLLRLVIAAITEWRTTPHPIRPTWLDPQFHYLFAKQSDIGWNHILLGRFSTSWQIATKKSNIQTTKWISYVITRIWIETYKIWKQRCETNHGLSTDEQNKKARLKLEPKVIAVYDQQPTIDQCDQYIFSSSLSDMLARPPAVIKQWLHKATLRLQAIKERQKIKLKSRQKKQTSPFLQ
jgi:hypothetical protein